MTIVLTESTAADTAYHPLTDSVARGSAGVMLVLTPLGLVASTAAVSKNSNRCVPSTAVSVVGRRRETSTLIS